MPLERLWPVVSWKTTGGAGQEEVNRSYFCISLVILRGDVGIGFRRCSSRKGYSAGNALHDADALRDLVDNGPSLSHPRWKTHT